MTPNPFGGNANPFGRSPFTSPSNPNPLSAFGATTNTPSAPSPLNSASSSNNSSDDLDIDAMMKRLMLE